MNYIDALAAQVESAIQPSARPSENAIDLYRLYALLVLTTGENTTLRNVHDAWSVWMVGVDSAHESLVPFADLSPDVRAEDRTYCDAIIRVAREARSSSA